MQVEKLMTFYPISKSSYCSLSPDAANRWQHYGYAFGDKRKIKLIENEGVNSSGSRIIDFDRAEFKIIR
jgi:hypothetical protein